MNVIAPRDTRAELSYMQLIEVAVVSAMRRGNIRLDKIKAAHDYFGKVLESEFPFAEYRFKAVGSEIGLEYDQIDPQSGFGKLIQSGGQYGWSDILKPILRDFDYEDEGLAVRWRVAGPRSSVLIDPQIAFGAPQTGGVATWAVLGRYNAGESVSDIAGDLGLDDKKVIEALEFEGVEPDLGRPNFWVN